MKGLLLLSLLLSGCATGQRGSISTYGVLAAVQSAGVSTQKATRGVKAAKLSLEVAANKTSELLLIATPRQKPLVVELDVALKQAALELDGTLRQLDATQGALTDSSGRIETLQASIDTMGADLSRAQEKERKERVAKAFWRGVALKLSILSAALALWVFRKPIAALFGVPML